MEIIKKIYYESFENISSGKKKFELRLADEKYNIGDILVLKEIDSDRKFTGREIKKKISYIARTKDCNYWPQDDMNKYGFIIIQLE